MSDLAALPSSTAALDGTQAGDGLGADEVLAELADYLLYHGDVEAALRRLLQSAARPPGAAAGRAAGAGRAPRRRRREELARDNLGGAFDAAARALREIVGIERATVEDLERAARESGDARRREVTAPAMAERRLRLDLLPSDLAGQVRSPQGYDFASEEARRRFEELLERLRRELMAEAAGELVP